MASAKLFEAIPHFPDDVPIAPINTIPLGGLRSGDEATTKRVLAACQELGFFMLDLQGDELGDTMIEEVDQLFDMSMNLLNLPEDVKLQYLQDIPKSFLGFKYRGQAKTETQEPDRFEWFNVGQDGIMGNAPLQPLPPQTQSQLPLLRSFVEHGQSIIGLISSVIATQLGLPPDAFVSRQRPSELSGTVVRLIKVFASPEPEDLRTSMIHHTDFGTITLLANVLGGLQILAPGKPPTDEDGWLWVRPQPGCLIVNLGDAMVQWTGGLLRSNVHRVNYAPGPQRFVDRYSVAILARPEREANMKRLIGDAGEDSDLSAWEWEVKKTMALVRGENAIESKGGRPIVVGE